MASNYPVVRTVKGLAFWRKHENQETSVGDKYYLVDILHIYKRILFSPKNPILEKRWHYLYGVTFPRLKRVFILMIKNKDIKKIKYILTIMMIFFFKPVSA
jgi:hypothetical protein